MWHLHAAFSTADTFLSCASLLFHKLAIGISASYTLTMLMPLAMVVGGLGEAN